MLAKAYVRVGMFDEANDALFQTRRQGFVPHIMSCNFFLMNRLIEYGKIDMGVTPMFGKAVTSFSTGIKRSKILELLSQHGI